MTVHFKLWRWNTTAGYVFPLSLHVFLIFTGKIFQSPYNNYFPDQNKCNKLIGLTSRFFHEEIKTNFKKVIQNIVAQLCDLKTEY